MIEVRTTRSAREGRRWLGLAAVAAVAVLIPAALALACSPQAYLTLNGSFAPGDTVRVSGSFFVKDTAITVSLDPTSQSKVVMASSSGSFQTSFTLPANAPFGGYTVTAIGYDSNGDVIQGLPQKASFAVTPPTAAQPQPQPQPSSTPVATATPQATSQSAPAGSQPVATTSRPAARPAGKPSAEFSEPRVFSEPNVSKSAPSTPRATSKPAAPRTDRAAVNGRAVFGGSVAPVTGRVAFAPTTNAAVAQPPRSSAKKATGSAPASTATSQQAAEQTAAEDVWSAQTAGSAPSVLPVAGDGVAVSSPRAGSQLALGIVLLGGGVLALLGGLVAGEARRRRVRVR